MKFLVDFVDGASSTEINAWLTNNNATIEKTLNAFKNTYVIDAPSMPEKTEFVQHLHADAEFSTQLLTVTNITPLEVLSAPDHTFNINDDWWKTACIYETDYDSETTTIKRRGKNTMVYVVDSGIDSSNPEFAGLTITNLYSVDGNFNDTRGHGTALASVIVGDTLGITNSNITSVKILSDTVTTMISDLVTALDAILQDLINNTNRLNIVNMSWSIPKNSYVEIKINELINAGAIVVASAGNSGVPIENVTPASMENVFTVGAYDQDFKPANFSDYTAALSTTQSTSNHGALDVWAPGVDIKIATIGNSPVGYGGGTSISAAIASACLAYNSEALYIDNILVPFGEAQSLLPKITFAKKGILDLSDPKYADSINLITCFNSKVGSRKIGLNPQNSKTFDIWPGRDVYGWIGEPYFAKSMTLEGNLPEGLSFKDGWIIGRIVNPPTQHQRIKFLLTAVLTNDETSQITVYLNLLKDTSVYPIVDEEAQILLEACLPITPAQTGCGGPCPPGSTCASFGTQKPIGCGCVFPSDIELKTDIEKITNASDIVKQLEGVGFSWKNNGERTYGFIAQHVERIIPEIISERAGYKEMDYNAIVAILAESNKELLRRVEELEKKLTN